MPSVGIDDSKENLLAWISQQAPLSILVPGSMAQIFGLAPGEARSTLLTAMKVGIVEPVYRLATTEILEDFFNDWSPDLSRFRRNISTVMGVKIDGANPENIEVAFQRVTASKEGTQ